MRGKTGERSTRSRREAAPNLPLPISHQKLANAYRSGASSWSGEERQRYANDPDVLLSVEDDANQQKGDKGPEAWKPPTAS